jgi:hypothetical protein
MQQGIELLASDRGAGRFVESLFEATQRIERDAGDSFRSSSAWPRPRAIAT